jgi:rubrerythrin
MKKWICPVCGYEHEGETPPDFCPICKVPGSKFKEAPVTGKETAE